MNKLELTWIGKDKPIEGIEPRILVEDFNLSYSGSGQQTMNLDNSGFDNMLIHGDNLLALKSLEQDYAGKVKCIYIDPPYNTGSAFEHYDDNLEHSTWLNLMKPRLELLKNLLSEDGSVWISIDADESHYLKVLCDEVFGRNNFIEEIIWQRAFAPVNLKKTLSRNHDTILVYAKKYSQEFSLNKIARKESQIDTYKNPDNDIRGVWTSADCTVGPVVKEKLYQIKTPNGRTITPPEGRCWLFTEERFKEMLNDNRIWFGKDGNNAPRVKKFLSEVRDGMVSMTLWLRDEVGDNQEAKKEVKALNLETVFATPKPERLIERILTLGSNPGDIVLDSFLGSGTTAAVAHKMGRKWIGIELGEHCYTHCKPRLDAVIDGRDEGGITKSTGFKGGGGYKFYELAPTLVKTDKYGQAVINPEYNADMLAMAMAKHEGYKYSPDKTVFYKQGKSNENSYIFTTTQLVTRTLLEQISLELQPGEHLLISCRTFESGIDRGYKNITVKKIPQSILNRCKFEVENYNLNIKEGKHE